MIKKSILFFFALLVCTSMSTSFGKETVLWNLDPSQGGPGFPYYDSLSADAHGNLYGATGVGGANGSGAVFKLVPNGSSWTASTIYNFPSMYDNEPVGAPVIDSAGRVFGASNEGGTHNTGYVYELTPNSKGGYTETVLHNFAPCCKASADGSEPYAGLIMDSSGNLYGTTTDGGTANFGTIFELSPAAGGAYQEKVLHSFTSLSAQGDYPEGTLAIDASGNLYGTTSQGGIVNQDCPVGCGLIFKLAKSGGTYSYSILHKFTGGDGQYPRYSNVVVDASGNLYGTTEGGGASNTGVGVVWELAYSAAVKAYSYSVLHSFNYNPDGSGPIQGVTLASNGSLYGATAFAGANSNGVIYRLTKSGSQWNESILYTFTGGADGGYPSGNPVVDATGNVYGLTQSGGSDDNGVVYKIAP